MSDPLTPRAARREIGARQAPHAKSGERDERKIVETREEKVPGPEEEERRGLMILPDRRHEEDGAEGADHPRGDDVAEVASRMEDRHQIEDREPQEEDAGEAKVDLLVGHRKAEKPGQALGRDEDGQGEGGVVERPRQHRDPDDPEEHLRRHAPPFPHPPPPGVFTTRTSPAPTVTRNLPGILSRDPPRRWRVSSPGAPGSPPPTPQGLRDLLSASTVTSASERNSYSRTRPSPPRRRPPPPDPSRKA